MSARRTWIAAWLCCASIACSGSHSTGTTGSGTAGGTNGTGSTTGGTSGSITSERACGDYASAACTLISSCSQGFLISRDYGEYTSCTSDIGSRCLNALGAPSNAETPADRDTCANALNTLDCTDYFDDNFPTACNPVPGPLTLGVDCYADGQCQSAFCAIPAGAVCGTCEAQPQAGDSCVTASCGQHGLVCSSETSLCIEPVADGGACNNPSGCQAGFDCLGLDAGGAMGICQPKATQQGFACDAKHFTNTTCYNRLGLFCSSVKLCDKIQLVDAGTACGEDAGPLACVGGPPCIVEEQIDCWGGAACVEATAGAATCVASVGAGSTCDINAGPLCAPGSGDCLVSSGSAGGGVCAVASAALCQ